MLHELVKTLTYRTVQLEALSSGRAIKPKDRQKFSRIVYSMLSNRPVKKAKASSRDEVGFRMRAQKLKNLEINDDDQADGAKYILNGDGLRRVTPYYYTYLTYCKQRWRDRELLDIFANEFRDRDESYYRWAIENGQVLLNGKVAQIDTVVRNGDAIQHRSHKHEPPVTDDEIDIVHEDDDLVVIDKPSGMPVHPAGRYRFNTAVNILKHVNGLHVHPCNRLDRLTSGLMFMAKNPKSADKFGAQLRDRQVQKQYVARVVGRFPDGEITVDEPLCTLDPRIGFNIATKKVDKDHYRALMERATERDAKTVFKRISYDGETSIVLCKPYTGRTHQIRVHLQFLGHPIANDPLYSSPDVWGPSLGKGALENYDVMMKKIDDVGKTKTAESWYFRANPDQPLGEVLSGTCDTCKTPLYTDPGPNDLSLWLHAFTYSSKPDKENPEAPKWSYSTKLPEWATAPHKQFMEMAVREADKSEGTETAFCVGAVLVKNGEVLETGYSRELPGNTHAEQCALEKYYAKNGVSDVPEGTVIYTTMEPCSERLSGNLPCVDRILNSNIKTVFVGVLEPDDFIKDNTSLAKLEEAGVSYIQIPGYEEESIRIAKKGHPEEKEEEHEKDD